MIKVKVERLDAAGLEKCAEAVRNAHQKLPPAKRAAMGTYLEEVKDVVDGKVVVYNMRRRPT